MESIVLPRRWEWFGEIENLFKALRASGLQGEEFCLEKNMFVEKTIPEHVIRTLTDDEMARYRAPYGTREARLPTLIWARQVAIEDDRQPADVYALVNAYSKWLARSPGVPKLFIKGDPGLILRDGGDEIAYCRSWPNQREVAVRGRHFLQEDSPHEIGRAIHDFVKKVHG